MSFFGKVRRSMRTGAPARASSETVSADGDDAVDKLRYLREPEPLPGYDQNRPAVNAKVASPLHGLREPAAGSEESPVRGNALRIKVEPETGLGTP